MQNLIAVFLLGLSVEGLVLCPFVSFGLAMADRSAGLRFLGGRLLGLVVFGLFVTWAGSYLHLDSRIVNLAFGLFVVVLGVSKLLGDRLGALLPARSRPKGCQRGQRGKGCRAGKVGFVLGFSRGLLNPGRKYVYLAPLLIGAGLLQGLVTSLVFGLSSSVYLVLGFLAAGAFQKLERFRPYIGVVAGLVLVVMGAVFTSRAVSQFSDPDEGRSELSFHQLGQ